jgi:hypothetical protein
VVGIFPNPAACLRLIGMLLVEKNDDWLTDDKAYSTFDDAPVEESAAKERSVSSGCSGGRRSGRRREVKLTSVWPHSVQNTCQDGEHH